MPGFDAAWDHDRPDTSESAFRALLAEARHSDDREYLPQLLTQIARAEGLQMKFEEAWRTLDQAEAALTPATPVARVRLLLERGRVLNSSKRREESIPLFLEAWERAREAEADGFAVDAAHMMGIVESDEESVAWNLRAIALAAESADPKARRWLGSLYNNLAWTFHGRGDFAAALDLFEKALAAREAEGSEQLIRIARWSVARALRSLGRVDEAIRIQRSLLAAGEADGAPDGYVHEEIAECLLSRDPSDGDAAAAPHFAAAYRLLARDAWLSRDEPDRLERMRRLGA